MRQTHRPRWRTRLWARPRSRHPKRRRPLGGILRRLLRNRRTRRGAWKRRWRRSRPRTPNASLERDVRKEKGRRKGRRKGSRCGGRTERTERTGRTERTERLRRDRDRRWFARRRRRVSRRRCGRCSGTTCERSVGARWVARRTGRVKMKGCNNSSRASEVDERRNDSFFAARTISRRLDTCRARLIGKRWMSVGRLDGVGMRTCVMVRGIRSRARRRNPRP